MDPRQAITRYLEDDIRARRLFKSVEVQEHGANAAYVLSGYIERLEEVDQGRDVSAVCTISAQLLDTRTRSVVWSHTASDTVAVEKRDIVGVVSGLSAAARTAGGSLAAVDDGGTAGNDGADRPNHPPGNHPAQSGALIRRPPWLHDRYGRESGRAGRTILGY